MLNENERIALYTLMEIPGMYTRKLNSLYRVAGSFQEILQTGEAEFQSLGLLANVREKGILDRYRDDEAFLSICRDKYSSLQSQSIRMIDLTEPEMPARFMELTDPPNAVFVRGCLPDPEKPCAAMIGARECSDYGSEVARSFGRKLSEAGVQILSGMAMGIDACALEGGLEGSSGCFGVLGSGVNICYPRSSRTIYNRMCRGRGGVLSEYCPDAPPLGFHFVTRNRLIAALCDVLIVIEAKEKSGTTITVENALELGRDVFALPGRITDPLGYGCNRLIREGAYALTCPEDVLQYLGMDAPERNSRGCSGPMIPVCRTDLSEEEKKVLSLLGTDPVHMDELAARSGFPVSRLSLLLSSLESEGLVRDAGNACFVKRFR